MRMTDEALAHNMKRWERQERWKSGTGFLAICLFFLIVFLPVISDLLGHRMYMTNSPHIECTKMGCRTERD